MKKYIVCIVMCMGIVAGLQAYKVPYSEEPRTQTFQQSKNVNERHSGPDTTIFSCIVKHECSNFPSIDDQNKCKDRCQQVNLR